MQQRLNQSGQFRAVLIWTATQVHDRVYKASHSLVRLAPNEFIGPSIRTGRPLSTRFLFGDLVLTLLEAYTTFRIYAIVFRLNAMWRRLHDPWPLLSCVGGQQKVTSLSHHHPCVWIYCKGTIIMWMMLLPLQQHWLLLPKCVTNVNLRHLVQSK